MAPPATYAQMRLVYIKIQAWTDTQIPHSVAMLTLFFGSWQILGSNASRVFANRQNEVEEDEVEAATAGN